MIFATTAAGEIHRALAKRLADSFKKWGWPRLIVISDEPIAGVEENILADARGLWGGRALKTRFAQYLPDDIEGKVCFIDADCVAEAGFTGLPETPPEGMAGVLRKTYRRPDGDDHFLCSACLVFGSIQTAREVCSRWNAEMIAGGYTNTDEIALFKATRHVPKTPHGTLYHPLENLHHHLVTTPSRRRDPNELPGWFDFADLYLEAIASAPACAVMVEVGVWRGKSLAFLAEHANRSGKQISVIGYDQFIPEYYLGAPIHGITSYQWLAQVQDDMAARVPDRPPLVIKSDSAAAASLHDDGTVHFVFLDAGHREQDLFQDLAAWLPKIAPGGIIAGHDLDHPRHPGVRAALEKSGITWEPASRSSWVSRAFIKPSNKQNDPARRIVSRAMEIPFATI